MSVTEADLLLAVVAGLRLALDEGARTVSKRSERAVHCKHAGSFMSLFVISLRARPARFHLVQRL